MRRRPGACRRAPASRKAAARVGPPSRRRDWTPSAASASSSSGKGPERSSSSEPSGSGPRPNAIRSGWRTTGTSRASSRGLSQRTVPIPTATASDCARRTWTSVRDASPVTQREPGTRTRPSSVMATLYVTNGLPAVTHVLHSSICWRQRNARSLSASPVSTPASRSFARPPPCAGLGSSCPATTLVTPASSRASTHGGVAPWCAHGSSVT